MIEPQLNKSRKAPCASPCALCLKYSELCKSHVIPEFLYTPLYDSNHKYFIINVKKDGRNLTRPKGIYEKLLCKECETQISKYETYAKEVLNIQIRDNVEKIIRYNMPIKYIIKNVDYSLFKLFEMSLIWRSGVSKREELQKVHLGDFHEENLRKHIFSKDPGMSEDYGCMIIYTPGLDGIGRKIILPPVRMKKRLEGLISYKAFFAGFTWVFFISKQTHALPIKKEVFLSEEGVLQIMEDTLNTGVNFIKSLFSS